MKKYNSLWTHCTVESYETNRETHHSSRCCVFTVVRIFMDSDPATDYLTHCWTENKDGQIFQFVGSSGALDLNPIKILTRCIASLVFFSICGVWFPRPYYPGLHTTDHFRVLDPPPQVLIERYNCYKGHPGTLYGQSQCDCLQQCCDLIMGNISTIGNVCQPKESHLSPSREIELFILAKS